MIGVVIAVIIGVLCGLVLVVGGIVLTKKYKYLCNHRTPSVEFSMPMRDVQDGHVPRQDSHTPDNNPISNGEYIHVYIYCKKPSSI